MPLACQLFVSLQDCSLSEPNSASDVFMASQMQIAANKTKQTQTDLYVTSGNIYWDTYLINERASGNRKWTDIQ